MRDTDNEYIRDLGHFSLIDVKLQNIVNQFVERFHFTSLSNEELFAKPSAFKTNLAFIKK